MARKNSSFGDTNVKIIPTDTIKIYQVQESELNELEKGSNSDLYLEIAISCFSIFCSFLTSLLTVPIDGKPFIIFTVIAIITVITGLILLLLWHRCRKEKQGVINKIRSHEEKIQG
jgi:hypothetical protein